ncbi:hypothetical protein G3N59_10530 [Paraburkholderia sp. Ac-20340]|uniref:hypothetical protein n=1 Tax=Paraburkholderia sp. Ac-20340 TaxID=2703888 RepID=UPI00197F8FC4|nr:hypothetical protein [Paraburkholderia sp. Ac-20340]MBN3853816.1 hypothetical protein [Paraburkholderia sp. Ac-20340]
MTPESNAPVKRQKNTWTNHEVAIVRKHYPTLKPLAEIVALLPRHTQISIEEYARKILKLRRPRAVRQQPAWDRMRRLLAKPRSQAELADALGFSKPRACELLRLHRADVHIGGWRWPDGLGSPTPLWVYGGGPDMPRPMGRQRAQRQNVRRSNPISALVAMAVA